MKICVVGLRGMPGVMGGIEKHCEQIYPRLASLDGKIDILVTGRSPYLPSSDSRYRNVRIKSLWAVKNKYLETLLHTFLAVLYARFIGRADIVHIHAIGPGLFAPLAKLLGMKVVVTHHGADYNRQKWSGFAKRLLIFGEKLAITSSDATIVVGSTLCEQLKQQYPEHADKLVYIPNGAEVDTKESVGLPEPHPILGQFGIQQQQYILAVGRLVPEKGFQDLLKAYQSSQSPYKLVIAGASDHPDDFSRRLLSEQSDRIIFTGFQRGDALAAIYRNAALFVLPSYHEGLPIAALEALSYGLPVLLSDIGPNLDVELPSACYFGVGNCEQLANKLATKNYANYRVDTQRILDSFNWDDIANRTLRVYEHLLGSSCHVGNT